MIIPWTLLVLSANKIIKYFKIRKAIKNNSFKLEYLSLEIDKITFLNKIFLTVKARENRNNYKHIKLHLNARDFDFLSSDIESRHKIKTLVISNKYYFYFNDRENNYNNNNNI